MNPLTSLSTVLILTAICHVCESAVLAIAEQPVQSQQCQSCSSNLVDLLNEIQQDIEYANKTISLDRLSLKLQRRFDQLEDLYKDHLQGLKSSQDSVNYSLNRLVRSLGLDNNFKVEARIIRMLTDKLEVEAISLDNNVKEHNVPDMELRQNLTNLMSNLELAFERHIGQQIEVHELEGKMSSMATLDYAKALPYVENLFVTRARDMFADQVVDGALLKSIHQDASRRIIQIGEFVHECNSYRRSRAASVVESNLKFAGKSSLNAQDLSNWSRLVNDTSLKLASARQSLGATEANTIEQELSQALNDSRQSLESLGKRLGETNRQMELLKLDNLRLDQMIASTQNLIKEAKFERARFQDAQSALSA